MRSSIQNEIGKNAFGKRLKHKIMKKMMKALGIGSFAVDAYCQLWWKRKHAKTSTGRIWGKMYDANGGSVQFGLSYLKDIIEHDYSGLLDFFLKMASRGYSVIAECKSHKPLVLVEAYDTFEMLAIKCDLA